MKILIEMRNKEKLAPKRRFKICDKCCSFLLVHREDCYEAETVLGLPAWGVDCPVCGKALNVGGR